MTSASAFPLLVALALPCASALGAVAAPVLPHVFGDHMVLQAGAPVPIWGRAAPGALVTVSFAGQHKQVTAAPGDGSWRVVLEPLAVSAEAADLTVATGAALVFHDVLVGEVWLCAGQSNMQKPVGAWRGQPVTTVGAAAELAAANHPLIRLMNVEIALAAAPAWDIDASDRPRVDYPWRGWVPCSPASLDEIKFSAVGYFFACRLAQELHAPIGIIEASAGGTSIENWTPAGAFAADPALAAYADAAKTPKERFHGTPLTMLYNGMIHPLVPFALRGVLWYQGESNLIAGDGAIYADKQAALIAGWRAAWGAELPFYYVQLPPLLYSQRKEFAGRPLAEPLFREAQAQALALPRTGMVVTTDVGDLGNIHPPRKKEVGERLARWALARDYGRSDVTPSGPIYRPGSIEREGPKAVLHFDHVGKGLASLDGKALTWFSAAGADGRFHPAAAAISGDAIVVTSAEVAEPREVRFAFDEAAEPNFGNRDGLPAAPFRTDALPVTEP